MEHEFGSWATRLVTACQSLVTNAGVLPASEFADAARTFACDLAPPGNRAQETLLRLVLMSAVLEIEARSLLRDADGDTVRTVTCFARSRWQELPALFADRVRNALAVRNQPRGESDLAERAARVLEREYARCHSVRDLAGQLGCHPKRLQQQFRSKHHTTVHRYLDRVRAAEAIRLIGDEGLKVEAAALMVGLRSRKNLYHLVKRTTGRTVREVRGTRV